MAKIVVAGSLNMDLVAVAPKLPAPGETLIGHRYFTAHGGKGGNQAYAAACLGGDVAMLGCVGGDQYGALMRAHLESAGCNVAGVRIVEGSSGVALIFVSDAGQNAIVVTPGANQAFTEADLEAGAQQIEKGGYLLLQLESPLNTVTAAAHIAKARGAAVILDPAPAASSLSQDLLARVDILTPNESEAALLVGRNVDELTIDDAVAIGEALRARGPRTVIVKLGSRGCLVVRPEGVTPIAAPKVKVADTTAAGDVFNAALAVTLSEGASLIDACHVAVQAAALSVTRYGAQPSMPIRQEVDALRVRPSTRADAS